MRDRRPPRAQVPAAGVQRAGRRPPDGGLWPGGYTDQRPARCTTVRILLPGATVVRRGLRCQPPVSSARAAVRLTADSGPAVTQIGDAAAGTMVPRLQTLCFLTLQPAATEAEAGSTRGCRRLWDEETESFALEAVRGARVYVMIKGALEPVGHSVAATACTMSVVEVKRG